MSLPKKQAMEILASLSVNTVCHAIHKCRLKLYHTKKKPYGNMIQKHCHLLWPETHLNLWEKMWSDKSKLEIIFGNHRRCILRTKEEKDNSACYQRLVHHAEKGIVHQQTVLGWLGEVALRGTFGHGCTVYG